MTIMASVRIDYRVEELLQELEDARSDLLNAVMCDNDQDTMHLWKELSRNAETRKELQRILRLRRRNRLAADDARCKRIVLAFDLGPGTWYVYRPPVSDWPALRRLANPNETVEFRDVDWEKPPSCAPEDGLFSPYDV